MIAQTTTFPGAQEIADVLHDLRQPLSGIRALSSAPLPASGESQRAAELHERLRRIDELGKWMTELLESGFDAADGTPGACSADLLRVVQDVVLAAAASYEGSLRWCPSGEAHVLIEPTLLRRAVGNIVDNATRAAGPDGWVRVRIRTRRAGGRICVEVDDSGPGFGRVPAGSRRGLAATCAVVGSCGGAMEVGRSRSGGALVRLTLPLARPEAPDWPAAL